MTSDELHTELLNTAAHAYRDAVQTHRDAINDANRTFTRIIRNARAGGVSVQTIADECGYTRARIYQLLEDKS